MPSETRPGTRPQRAHRQVTYRLLPQTRDNWRRLERVLESQRQLYNAALQERSDAWRLAGVSLSYIDQAKSLTVCRRELPEMAAVPVAIQRGTLKRVDEAFHGFFRRARAGQKPGYPYPCPTSDAGQMVLVALRCLPWRFSTRSSASFPSRLLSVASPRCWMRAKFRIARRLRRICVLNSGSGMGRDGLRSPPVCRRCGPWSGPGRSGFRSDKRPVEPVSGGVRRRRLRRPGTSRRMSGRFEAWSWLRFRARPIERSGMG